MLLATIESVLCICHSALCASANLDMEGTAEQCQHEPFNAVPQFPTPRVLSHFSLWSNMERPEMWLDTFHSSHGAAADGHGSLILPMLNEQDLAAHHDHVGRRRRNNTSASNKDPPTSVCLLQSRGKQKPGPGLECIIYLLKCHTKLDSLNVRHTKMNPRGCIEGAH